MDTIKEFPFGLLPGRARVNPREPRRSRRHLGTPPLEHSARPPSVDEAIALFTLNAPEANSKAKEEIRTGEVTKRPTEPDQSTILVSRIRTTPMTNPADATTMSVETEVTGPWLITQKLLTETRETIESRMRALLSPDEEMKTQFGSKEYLKLQHALEELKKITI